MAIRITIGILHSNRELSFESDLTLAEAEKLADAAKNSDSLFRAEDNKGKVLIIPSRTIAYIELGEETARKVGFVG